MRRIRLISISKFHIGELLDYDENTVFVVGNFLRLFSVVLCARLSSHLVSRRNNYLFQFNGAVADN